MSSDTEFLHIGRLLRRTQQAQSHALDFVQAYGVTAPQFSVLSAVVSRPGIDQRSVSAETFIDKSTLAGVVGRLAHYRLIYASRSLEDGRRARLMPSEDAVRLVYEATPELLNRNEDFISVLIPASRVEFRSALQVVGNAGSTARPGDYLIPSPDGRPSVPVVWGPGRLLRASLQRYGQLWAKRIDAVTPLQASALAALAGGGRFDQRALGEAIGLDKASVTEMLDRLVRRKLVGKVPDPSDGRRRVLELSAAGASMAQELESEIRCVDEDFLSPLDSRRRPIFVRALISLASARPEAPGQARSAWLRAHARASAG